MAVGLEEVKEVGHHSLGINAGGMQEFMTVCPCGKHEIWDAHPEAGKDFLKHIPVQCGECVREFRA